MIVFSIAVPTDIPAPVIDWLRRTVVAARVYLESLGFEPITAEIIHGEDDDDEQQS